MFDQNLGFLGKRSSGSGLTTLPRHSSSPEAHPAAVLLQVRGRPKGAQPLHAFHAWGEKWLIPICAHCLKEEVTFEHTTPAGIGWNLSFP